MTEALTIAESTHLARLEKILTENMATFRVVGETLAEIQSQKLYRAEHETFEEYCADRWGFTGRRGRQYIEASAIVKLLPDNLAAAVDNDATARELGKLPEEKRAKVISDTLKKGKKLTPAGVRKRILPPVPIAPSAPAQTNVRRDSLGTKIPKAICVLWDKCDEIEPHVAALSCLRALVRKAEQEEDKRFIEINFSELTANLNAVWTALRQIKPFVVCPTCQGLNVENCRLCRGRGFISKVRWDLTIPDDKKKIIAAAAKKS